MLSVQEARARLIDLLSPIEDKEQISIDSAFGRVLAENVRAKEDAPPFSNSSMDGFAVLSLDSTVANKNNPIELKVVDDIPAGRPSSKVLKSGQVMRIMTGASLPEGADAVIPVEYTSVEVRNNDKDLPDTISIFRQVSPGDHVRNVGEDFKAGTTIISTGHRLRPQDLGALAQIGLPRINVFRRPRVALFSSGDELLPVEADLQPGKIRDTNSSTLSALLQGTGVELISLGVARDDEDSITEKIESAVNQNVDLIVSSAGVSVGTYDYVRSVLEEHGELNTWRVNMRPGKPLAFGHYGSIPFVGLPGNPVSSFVGFEVFLRPALHHLSGERGWQRIRIQARLIEEVHSDGRETYLRAVLEEKEGEMFARLSAHQGSGNLFSLVAANGLIILPAGVKSYNPGSVVEAWILT